MVSYAGEPASGQRSHQHLTSQQKEIILSMHLSCSSWKLEKYGCMPNSRTCAKIQTLPQNEIPPPNIEDHSIQVEPLVNIESMHMYVM